MADPTTQQPQQQSGGFDPFVEFGKRYDTAGMSEPDLYPHLRNPKNFRSAFPDVPGISDLKDDEITSNVDRIYSSHYAPQHQLTGKPLQLESPDFATDTQKGALKSFSDNLGVPDKLSDYWEGPKYAIQHPIDSAKLLYKAATSAQDNTWKRAADEIFNKKDYVGGAADTAYSMLPVLGPALSAAGHQAADHNPTGALGSMLGLAAPAAMDAGVEGAMEHMNPARGPSVIQTQMLRKAVKPNQTATTNALKFPEQVRGAWDAIQTQITRDGVPKSPEEFAQLLKRAKQEKWAQYNQKLQAAQAARPPIRGLLPAASGEVSTGYTKVVGEDPGGVYPAPTRLSSDSITDGVYQATTEPGLHDPQYMGGGSRPDLSGQVTNPGVMTTRDPKVLAATRDRLAQVVNNPDHMNSLSPGEQQAYTSQLSELNHLLEPGPKNATYGPSISGDTIADSIEGAVRPMHEFENTPVAQRAHMMADAYRGKRIPLAQAEEFLQDANSEAQGWHNMLNPDPHAKPSAFIAEAKAKAIRQQLYDQIDKLSESDPGAAAQLKREYGALDAIYDHTLKRIPVSARQNPFNLADMASLAGGAGLLGAEVLGGAHGFHSALAAPLPFVASRLARHVNSPEYLIPHALKPTAVPEILRSAVKSTARGAVGGSAIAQATHVNPHTGQKIHWDGKQWVDANTGNPLAQGKR